MAFLTVDIENVRQIERLLTGIPDGAQRAMTEALNKTAAKARLEGIKGIRQDVRLTAAYLKTKIWGPDERPYNRATFNRLVSMVNAETRGLRMVQFLTTPIGSKPIKTKIKPSGASTEWPGGFFIRLRAGSQAGTQYGLFVREGGNLKHVYGPSASQVWTEVKDEIAGPMDRFLAEQMFKSIDTVIRRFG